MNNKLYVAGDSFASLVKNQPEGNSWAELLANNLDLKLCNIARPAASNFSIALQIDWILKRITDNDLVVVYLTDHIRKTLVDLNVDRDPTKELLELHSLHRDQRDNYLVDYSSKPRLINSYLYHDGRVKEYYKDWFDLEIQEIEDQLIILGALTNMKKVTNNFLVCRGGFKENDSNLSYEHLNIEKKHYLPVTSNKLESWSEPCEYINHIDDLTHKKFVLMIQQHLNKYFNIQ